MVDHVLGKIRSFKISYSLMLLYDNSKFRSLIKAVWMCLGGSVYTNNHKWLSKRFKIGKQNSTMVSG